jgi:dolichol-phosphate mannosyltransferase
VLGVRNSRKDSIIVRITSALYWAIYKVFSPNAITTGGYDVFAMNNRLVKHLMKFDEYGNNLTSQIDQIGFGRKYVTFNRKKRELGQSTWSFRKRAMLAVNSFYNYTTIPILIIAFSQIMILFPLLYFILNIEKNFEIVFFISVINLNMLILTYYVFLIHRNSNQGLSKNFIVEDIITIQ